jgi:hypothetical protein
MVREGFKNGGALRFQVSAIPDSPAWHAMLNEIAKIQYNDFNGEIIAQFLHANHNDYRMIRFGREYSPVLYLEYFRPLSLDDIDELRTFFTTKGTPTSELNVSEDDILGDTVRLWWD